MSGLRTVYLLILGAILLLSAGCTTVLGNYTLESGQVQRGNLLIRSGTATLEEGSLVTGDVLMTRGNILANGEIEGDILFFWGNVSLGPQAVVHGDIRGISGLIQKAEGAHVDGLISIDLTNISILVDIIANLFLWLCLLSLTALGGLIFLVVILVRRRRATKLEEQDSADNFADK
jgi:hypothetical protein